MTTAPVEHSVTIRRPDWEIFTFLANPENDVLWRPATLLVRRTNEGPLGLGGRYWYVVHGFPFGRSTGLVSVTAYLPDRRVEFAGSFDSGVQSRVSYELKAVPYGTQISAVVEPGERGLRRFFRFAVRARLGRRIRADLQRLKRLLEDPARDARVWTSLRR